MKKIFNPENSWVRQNNTVIDIIEHLYLSTNNNETAFLTGDEDKSWESCVTLIHSFQTWKQYAKVISIINLCMTYNLSRLEWIDLHLVFADFFVNALAVG